MTYGTLRNNVDLFARSLSASGVRRGDRVAFVLSNGPELVQCVLGIAALGAAACPLNPAYTTAEYRFFLGDLAPRYLLLPEGRYGAAREAAFENVSTLDLRVKPPTGLTVRDRDPGARAAETREKAEGEDIALLLHTSGTTSRPKQVPLLHRNLLASVGSIVAHYGLADEDVSFCSMPLFHVHGLVACVFAALAAGGTVVVPRRNSPSGFWGSLEKHSVSWFSAAPSLHLMLLDKRPERHQSPSSFKLRFLRSSSSALSERLSARIEETFAAPMLQAYGMTEASHQIASNPLPPGSRLAESVGVPTGTEVVILDRDGSKLPLGQTGEVAVRGPSITPGYLENPQANDEAFMDGWFRTGDRGRLDDKGYIYLSGRIKEIIIRGGENISPTEVEDVLRGHPAVSDAVCFPVPDEKYGECVGAGVVVEAAVEKDELLRYCAEFLTASKIPVALGFLAEIPRTSTGKPRRLEAAALVSKEADH